MLLTDRNVSRARRFVHDLDGDYLMRVDVADILGVSQAWLAQLGDRATGNLGASHRVLFEAKVLYLYTPSDLNRIWLWVRAHGQGSGKRGTTKLWTAAELLERQRAQMRVQKHRKGAREGYEIGDDVRAAAHDASAARVQDELDRSLCERKILVASGR